MPLSSLAEFRIKSHSTDPGHSVTRNVMIHNTDGQLRNEIRQIHFTEGNHVTRFVGFTLQRGQPRDPLIDTT